MIFLHKTNQNRIEWTMKYSVCNCVLDLMLPGHKHQWRSGSYRQSRHYSPDVTHGLYLLLSQYTCGVSYLCYICECLGLVGNFITYDNLLWGFSSTLLHATHHQVNVFLIGGHQNNCLSRMPLSEYSMLHCFCAGDLLYCIAPFCCTQ